MTTTMRLSGAWVRPVAALAAAAWPALAGAQGACFSSADDGGLKFEVMQQAPPPKAGAASYSFYPLNAASTMQLGSLEATPPPGVAEYYFQWANRYNAPMNVNGRSVVRKPNIQPSASTHRQQRTPFSSLDKANACTLAQAAVVLGLPSASAEDVAGPAGVKLVSETDAPDQGDVGPTDVCVLAAHAMPAAARGIVLDYEVGDGRTPAQTLAFLTRFAALVHQGRRRAILLTDPLNAPSQHATGIDASNANRLSRLFDEITVFLWARNGERNVLASYRNQLAELRAGGPVDPSHLTIDYDIEETTLADAKAVHSLIVSDHLAGVMIWRNRAKLGGSCTTPENQKLRCLISGCG